MSGDLSPELEELFHRALEVDPADRTAFLDRTCEKDSGLRQRIESLLRHHDRAGELLDEPPLGRDFHVGRIGAPGTGEEPEEPSEGASLVGTRLGPYELRELVGSGGMGSIYLAERADREFEKRVAVKVIKRGMDSEEVLRRFRRERQTLARLDHPNIARLIDGGSTGDGLPYLVMEHIEGEPIDAHCDRHRLAVTARLELFRSVCAAVEYAHRSLVVHRDIKPGNILVTADGTPKLLDFGIAKLLDTEGPGAAAATVGTHRFLTPEYASPEQVRGEPITTATDVYSLGVVLYELLTGRRPYRLTTRSPHEIARVVCEEQPERPSSAVRRLEALTAGNGEDGVTPAPELVSRRREGRPGRLSRRLAGDLDTIVLKALRKEPERRYTSVEQLGEDIRRHLVGLPVLARRDTLRYRTAKFIRRNAALVVSAVLVFAALVAGTVGVLVQVRRVEKERDLTAAAEERARADAALAERRRATMAYLFSRQEAVRIGEGRLTLLEMLDETREEMIQAAGDRPQEQLELLDRLSDLYTSLTLHRRAAALRERALEYHRGRADADELAVADCRHRLAESLYELRDLDAAIPHIEESLAIRRRHLGEESSEVASSHHLLGLAHFGRGDYGRAIELLERGLRLRRKLLGGSHADTVESRLQLGHVLLANGKPQEAAVHHREALALSRGLFRGDHVLTADALLHLGGTLQALGQLEESESAFRESSEMFRRIFGRDHPSLLTSKMALAVLLKDRNELESAEELVSEVRERRARLHGEDHAVMARTWWHLAQILEAKGDFNGATDAARQSLAVYRKRWPERHPEAARVLVLLGRVLIERGELEEAERCVREALEIYREKPPGHAQTAHAESVLEAILGALGGR